ncbi:hypothetical protein D3C81_1547750 [compost metagenome]
MLDGGHGVGLAIAHQCTFGERRTADTAADRCQDLGVAQVDLRAFERSLGLQSFGIGVVVFLLGDSLFVDQLLVALGQRAGGLQVGLGIGQVGFVHGRVDLVQLLAFLDLTAFLEQALEDDAVDLRAHFGDAVGTGTPRQFRGQGEGLGLDGHDADLRSLRRWRCFFFLTATEQGCQGDGGNQSGNGWLELHEDPRVAGAGRRSRVMEEILIWKKCYPVDK